jgi:hypothetical protein
MTESLTPALKQALSNDLLESLTGPIATGTLRTLHGSTAFPGKATVVIGMRRAGKTTLLHQLRQERMIRGQRRNQLPYINFEDERLLGLQAADLGFLLEEYGRQVPPPLDGGRVTWSFDEIQAIPGWEKFVRRLLDSGSAEVLITGSSAALLSREIGTSLRGRAWTVPLFPFSFPESLTHAGKTLPEPGQLALSKVRAQVEHDFRTWLEVGGFPEAQRAPSATRGQLLQDYVDVAMLRDVVERHGVTNLAGLRWLLRLLLGNAGGLFSVEKFHAALKSQGIAIGRDTVHELLGYLEDCFLVRTVWMEANSERQRMVNPRKAYPADQGLIPWFDRSGRANLGHALETAVLIELERRRCQVTYVRTASGGEVDFLASNPAGERVLIQVCADASAKETAARELRALEEAGRTYPDAGRLLLTLTRDGSPSSETPGVTVRPAYDWMLEQPAGEYQPFRLDG